MPVYLSLTGPPNMIISHVCQIRPDHFWVSHVSTPLQLGSLVQDYAWAGALVVLQYVAENSKELVVECAGWNIEGDKIVRYLVVDRSQVERLDTILVSLGGFTIHQRLPAALPLGMYVPRGCRGNDLPLPYPPILSQLHITYPLDLPSSSPSFSSDSIPDCQVYLWSVLCMV